MNKIAFALAIMIALLMAGYNFSSVADTTPSIVYVDDDYNETTPGWQETHFSSIQDAIDVVMENGTVVIYEGSYDGMVVINKTVELIGKNRPILNGHIIIERNGSVIKNMEIRGNSSGEGIFLNASGCMIEKCDISSFSTGINISGDNNTIKECNFLENDYGIISYGNSNTIHTNNFINNTVSACDYGDNVWYNNQTETGNYWSDFDEGGEGAVDGDGDGIADSPYNIGCGSSQDLYPLMNKIDLFPPYMVIEINGTKGENGWYVEEVNVTLEAYDNETDIQYINYSVDGNWNHKLGNTTTFSLGDGKHEIKYYAVDENGNTGRMMVANINVDTMPPSLSYTLNPEQPDGKNGWYVSNVEIFLNASDGISGINEMIYNIGGIWEDYTGFFALSTDGIYDIQFKVVDKAGNEAVDNVTLKIDKNAPSIAISKPDGGFVKDEYTIIWNAMDTMDNSLDGNISIFYLYNDTDGNWQEMEIADGINNTGNFTWNSIGFPDAKEAKIEIRAEDDAGNTGVASSSIFTLDNTPPHITIKQPVAGKAYGKDEYGNIIIEVEWEAYDSIDDNLDGSIKIQYFDGNSWNNLVENYTNSGRYTFNAKDWEDGNYKIRIYATDDAGNTGVATSANFTIDKQPPSIYMVRPLKGFVYINLFGRNIIPPIPMGLPLYDAIIIGDINVEVTASDAHSGIQRVEFEADGDMKPDYSPPYKWEWSPSFGVHSLKATAYDNAGNSKSYEMDNVLCLNI